MKSESITQLIQDKARLFGPKPALSMHGGGTAEQYTYAELDASAGRLATGFMDLGLEPGDRIALLSEARPRWGVAFFAAIRAGAVIVPLDTRASERELSEILDDAAPRYLLVSHSVEDLAGALVAGRKDLLVFSIEPQAENTRYESIDRISAQATCPYFERAPDDVAVITYTSGTMGHSKGVATTFSNLLFEIQAFRGVMLNDSRFSTVSILPLSHLFELTAGFLGVLYGGGSICYCNSLLPQDIVGAMRWQKPTCMTTVPLFLKLLADAIRREVGKQSRTQRVLFCMARSIARLSPLAIRRFLFRALRQRFGGRLEYFVCGGAPLDPATRRFFESVGMPVYEGYGLAETSPVITTNGPVSHRAGSVGKPLPGVEVRIANDGEILTRGPQVMRGYFGKPELTAKVIDEDGWLHTGDIGYFDHRGFLHVSGRQKNTIVLANGKKVQPEELEAVLFEHPFIEEGCVVGVAGNRGLTRGTEEVCAIAVANEAAIRYCATHKRDVQELVDDLIREQALRFPPFERPTRVCVRSEPLPRTSTRKVKRPEVCRWVAAEAI